MIFNLVDTESKLDELETILLQSGEAVIDLETTSLETHSVDIKIVGVGFCCNETNAYYAPVNEDNLERVLDIACNPELAKINHNIKYDARVFHRFGRRITNIKFDTLIAHYCLYSDLSKHNLDDITLEYYNHIKIRTKEVIPKKTKINLNPNLSQAPIESVAVYCCEDVIYTYKLYKDLEKELKQNKAAHDLFYNIELPLLPVIIDMECNGVAIDKAEVLNLDNKLNQNVKAIHDEVNTLAGRTVALTNPNDISKLLFDELKIHTKNNREIKLTKTNKYKTDQSTLELYENEEIVKKIIDVKKLNKLIKTYIASFPQYISGHTGMLHASFNQAVTATGRLSSSSPNLQNQPARDELGKEIRGVYISRWPQGKILSADYSQAELRILAHLSQEKVLLDIFLRGGDAHLGVASKIFDKEESKVTAEERRFIKVINFGMIYGMGPKRLGLALNISKDEAQGLIDRYLGTMVGVKKFIAAAEKELSTFGYTETFFGRRRYISKVFSQSKMDRWAAFREGANHKVQGTNADIVKLAMVNINKDLYNLNMKSLLILQVHDELVFDTHPDEIDQLGPLVKNRMENVVKFDIPMIADPKFGINWAESH